MAKVINYDQRINFKLSSKDKFNFIKVCSQLGEDKSKILREFIIRFNIEHLHLIQEQEESEGE
jgi:hypothetical protein